MKPRDSTRRLMQARAIHDLRKLGWSEAEIVYLLRISPRTYFYRLRLSPGTSQRSA